MSPPVGSEPCNVICPSCNKPILTKTEPMTTTKTHLFALLLCVLGCCLCAPCLYCTNCARNIEHTCPSCGSIIGTYER